MRILLVYSLLFKIQVTGWVPKSKLQALPAAEPSRSVRAAPNCSAVHADIGFDVLVQCQRLLWFTCTKKPKGSCKNVMTSSRGCRGTFWIEVDVWRRVAGELLKVFLEIFAVLAEQVFERVLRQVRHLPLTRQESKQRVGCAKQGSWQTVLTPTLL